MSYALIQHTYDPRGFVNSLLNDIVFWRNNTESSVTYPGLTHELSLRLAGERQSAISNYQLHTEVFDSNIRPENQQILSLLAEWYATPDDMGDAWWDEFEEDLKVNRLSIE